MGINLFSSTLSERETDWGVFIYPIDENSPHFFAVSRLPFPKFKQRQTKHLPLLNKEVKTCKLFLSKNTLLFHMNSGTRQFHSCRLSHIFNIYHFFRPCSLFYGKHDPHGEKRFRRRYR